MTDHKRPTSFDVARVAGVSRSAVSRAFTPGASINAQTREKIIAAAQDIGYRVNTLARNLQTQESQLVAVLASRMDSPVRARQVKLLTHALIKEGYRPLLLTAESASDVPRLLSSMLDYCLSGMIVTSDSPPDALIEECAKLQVPVVLINRDPSLAGGDRVQIDPKAAGHLAFDTLRAAGVQRFAAILPQDKTYSVAGRVLAFQAAALHAGFDCVLIPSEGQSYDAGRQAVIKHWDQISHCDGIFGATDLATCGVLDALRHDLGRSVPSDIQVLGFDDIEQASWGSYNMSSIKQDLEGQVSMAVAAMRQRLTDPDTPASLQYQTLTPVLRGTTK
ncbi:LacI family DNA-binding transcriptional regulator [Pacificibacter marinus]|uniref:Catabolite control protein A n=1 Tax=Pacificibacter marinus TaxID=658057 RepID=A0A1Y5SGT2_9RHOB|nr:LacI family DNA-binding transcriptional regulator [Pacificibacter marinus]SEK53108.1 transcriptional regulator, LacI family [Pacificibacter marinus]SLN38719.1 Catabolite control protein A [Pacificibacter marinus]